MGPLKHFGGYFCVQPVQFMLGVAAHHIHVKSTNRNYFLHPPVESPPVTVSLTVQQNFWDLQTKEDCVPLPPPKNL